MIKTRIDKLDEITGGLQIGGSCILSYPPASMQKKLLKYTIFKNLEKGIPCAYISGFQSFKDFQAEFELNGWKVKPSVWKKKFIYGDLFSSAFHEIMVLQENCIIGYFKKISHITEVTNRIINSLAKKSDQPFICAIDVLSRLSQFKSEEIDNILHENLEVAQRGKSAILYTLENGVFSEKTENTILSWMKLVMGVRKEGQKETLEVKKAPGKFDQKKFLLSEEKNIISIEVDRSEEGKSRDKIVKFLDEK